MRVHSATPRSFARLLDDFRIARLGSCDYSYVPLMPLKFTACLLDREYRPACAQFMDLLDHCRYIPTMRWLGKQLLAVCEKRRGERSIEFGPRESEPDVR